MIQHYHQSLDELPEYLHDLDYNMGIEQLRDDSFEITAISNDGRTYKVVKDNLREALLNMKLKITLVELQREPTLETPAKMLVMAKMDSIFKKDLIERSSMILHPESNNYQEAQKGMALMGTMKEYFKQFDDYKNVAEIDDFLKGRIKFENLSSTALNAYTQGAEYWKEEIEKHKKDNLLKNDRPSLKVVK